MLLPAALLFAAAGTAPSSAAEDPLEPLSTLSGACWLAPFPGGTLADLQCFEAMEGGCFIRARHIVLGSEPVYSGEAIYYVDGASHRLAFVYFTSLGGVSRGEMLPQSDGSFETEQIHVASDGSELRMLTEMRRLDGNRYRSATRRWVEGAWTEPFAAEYRRLPEACATLEEAQARCGTPFADISARE